jgi:thiol-disulfide isomerase/thioredoxin
MIQKAKVQDETGKISLYETVTKYKQEIEQNREDPELYVKAAEVFYRKESETLYKQSLSLSPDYLPARLGLARYYAQQRDEAALAEFEKAVALSPDDETLRVEAILSAGQNISIERLERLTGDSVKAKLAISLQLAWDQKFSEAEEVVTKLPSGTDFEGEILKTRAGIELIKADFEPNRAEGVKILAKATDLMMQAWRKNPDQRDLYPRRNHPRDLVSLLIGQKRYREAFEVIEKGLALYPTDYYLYHARWKYCFAEPKPDYAPVNRKISEEVRDFLKSHPLSPEMYTVALEGFEMAGDRDAAGELKQRIAYEYPFSNEARWFRFQEIGEAGDAAKKISLMKKFARDFPSFYELQYPDFLYNLDALNAANEDLLGAARDAVDDTRERGYGSMFLALQFIGRVFLRRNIYLEELQNWLDEEQPDPEGLLQEEKIGIPDAVILTVRANLLNHLGQNEQALNIIQRLEEIAPDHQTLRGEILHAKAKILNATGEKTNALLDLYGTAANLGGQYIREAKRDFLNLYAEFKGSESGAEEYLARLRGETPASESNEIEMNKPLPDFDLVQAGGGQIRSADLAGKVAVINFWATWCGPCKRELPHFQELYESLSDNLEVAIVTVSVDESRGLVQPFIAERKFTFPVGYDDGLAATLSVPPVPSMFIVDPAGNIRMRINGFSGGGSFVSDVTALIEKYKEAAPVSSETVESTESPAESEPVTWSLQLEASAASIESATKLNLLLTADIQEGWHLYSTERTDGGPFATQIELAGDSPFRLAGPIVSPQSFVVFDPNFEQNVSYYKNTEVFKLPVEAKPDARSGKQEIKVLVKYQVCSGMTCHAPKQETVTIDVNL